MMEQIKVKVLTAEEYARHKNPGYDTFLYVKKKKAERIKRLKQELEYFEGIIDLKYDKEGNAIFTPIDWMTFPKHSKFK